MSIKTDLAKLHRKLGSPCEAEYEAALARHDARLTVVLDDELTKPLAELAAEYGLELETLTEEEIDRINKARTLLEQDTPARWAHDQELIEAYHLRRYGHLEYINGRYAWGSDVKEMLTHMFSVAFADPEVRARSDAEFENAVKCSQVH